MIMKVRRRRTMKSSISKFTLILALLLGLLLVACARDEATPLPPVAPDAIPTPPMADTPVMADTPAPPPAAGVTELTLMGWASSDAENARLQQVVDTFNQDNDDINVVLNLVPDYDTRLQTSVAGGSPPDVFYIDSFRLPDFVQANVLVPAEAQLEGADDFYPSLRDAFTVDGTFYCPPKDFSTLALQYNTDMFDAAGLDYPNENWTWQDLRDAAEQLSDPAAGVYGMVLSADFARWIAFLYQAGGSVTDENFSQMTINSPEALAAMEFYVDMVLDGVAAQPSDLDSGWAGEAFGRERAAMAMEGNWIAPFLGDNHPDVNFGVAELPGGPAGKATMAFTVCYGVPAAGRHQEESFRLVNYLTGPEGMRAWTDLGLAMPTRQSLRAGWLSQFSELEPFLAGAAYAHPWQFRPGFQDVLDTINNGLQQAMTGAILPEDVLREAEQVGEEVLRR
jgi:multiple sugar transport system substrate-binding protein